MKTDIVILSKNQDLLSTCLASICKNVDKKSVGEIIVGWTGPSQGGELDMELLGFDVTMEALDHYNFAQNNNYLVEKHCLSEVVLFMNDDVQLVEDSVTKCLKWLEQPDIGTVGIKLLYLDNTIQHAGQFVSFQAGKFAGVGHIHWKQKNFEAKSAYRVIGNTGAFLMCRRDDFLEIGGFDESYKHSIEDVQFNLEMLKLRKSNVCDVTTWAWHAESQTRKQASCPEDMAHLKEYIDNNMEIFRGLV